MVMDNRQRRAMFARMNRGSTPVFSQPQPMPQQEKRGIIGRIKQLRKEHELKVQRELELKRQREQKELEVLQQQLKDQQLHDRVRAAKQQQIDNQKKQIVQLQQAKAKAKKELFERSKTGRVLKLVEGTKTTDQAFKKLRKQLGFR